MQKWPHGAGIVRTVVAQASRAPVANQRIVTYFRCGGQGHYNSHCPKLKNQNRGNKVANNDARRRAYALGGGDDNPDSNIVTGNQHALRAIQQAPACLKTSWIAIVDLLVYEVGLEGESDGFVLGCRGRGDRDDE
ncbi:hypothetical protein Tco_0691164 [Tanacetum coccineum]